MILKGNEAERRLFFVLFAFLLFLIGFLFFVPGTVLAAKQVVIKGSIISKNDSSIVESAIIKNINGLIVTISDSLGYFQLSTELPLSITITHINYEPLVVELTAETPDKLDLRLYMTRKLIPVDSIAILANREFEAISANPEYIVGTDHLRDSPQIANDIFGAVRNIPGITSSDYSAKFVVRGDEYDKILVLLDNMQLRNPFHLKDLDGGGMSFLDLEAISSISIIPGGFSARYGNYMGGVLRLTTKDLHQLRNQLTAGISLTNASVTWQGVTSSKNFGWLVSLRRGYVDVALDLMSIDTAISTTYYDTYIKSCYRLSDKQTFTGSFMFADDNLIYTDKQANDVTTNYRSVYYWLDWESKISSSVQGNTVISYSYQKDKRNGWVIVDSYEDDYYLVRDNLRYTISSLTSDWKYSISSPLSLLGGIAYAEQEAKYDYYYSREEVQDSITLRTEPNGTVFGVYSSVEFGLLSSLKITAGGRYDRISYTGDELISPRISAVLMLNEKNRLKFNWGRYYQSQGIDELGLPDRDTVFYPAEKAYHYILGYEHRKDSRNLLRINVYAKHISDRQPVYRVGTNQLYPFPEGQIDRIELNIDHTESRGMEFQVITELSPSITWTGSYVFSKVKDYLNGYSYEYGVVTEPSIIPGAYDQRHTIQTELDFRISSRVNYRVAAHYHSGWPYTIIRLDQTTSGQYFYNLGELYTKTYPGYNRLDMQIRYDYPTSHGRYRFYFDVINVLNWDNVQSYVYGSRWGSSSRQLQLDTEYWFHMMPSIGITYTHYL